MSHAACLPFVEQHPFLLGLFSDPELDLLNAVL